MADNWAGIRAEAERLGAAVRQYRQEKNFSQADVVELVERHMGGYRWNVPALSRLEQGIGIPDHNVGVALSALVGSLQAPLDVATPTPARSTDPTTSHTARPRSDTLVHQAILAILDTHGELAHHQILKIYDQRRYLDDTRYPLATEQRVRTATKELVDAGRVEATENTVLNSRGRKCQTWRLIQPTY